MRFASHVLGCNVTSPLSRCRYTRRTTRSCPCRSKSFVQVGSLGATGAAGSPQGAAGMHRGVMKMSLLIQQGRWVFGRHWLLGRGGGSRMWVRRGARQCESAGQIGKISNVAMGWGWAQVAIGGSDVDGRSWQPHSLDSAGQEHLLATCLWCFIWLQRHS